MFNRRVKFRQGEAGHLVVCMGQHRSPKTLWPQINWSSEFPLPYLLSSFLPGFGAGSSRSRAAVARAAPAINNSQTLDNAPPHPADGDAPPHAAVGGAPPHAADGDAPPMNNEETANQDEIMIGEVAADDEDEDANSHPVPARDASMESELANELKGDALDDYDIDVSNEGQAIAEYLSLLEAAPSSS